MTQTVIGLYDDIADAHSAVKDLLDNGYPRENISIIANDAHGSYARYNVKDKIEDLAPEGVGGGAVIGGLSGLLVGLGALTIPGIGPAFAMGPLLGVIGAGLGAVTGGLLGALVHVGVSQEYAEYYAEGVRRGGTLVAVQTSDELTADRAMQIINRYRPVDLKQRSSRWRDMGWVHYNPKAEPYTTDEIERERERMRAYDDRVGPARTA